MKALISFLVVFFLALPAYAVEMTMGSNGMLAFDPVEVSIAAGDTVRFVNGVLPPHNVIVEGHDELSHEDLAFSAGEFFEITFPDPGDYNIWCAPHKGAGMIGTVHVS